MGSGGVALAARNARSGVKDHNFNTPAELGEHVKSELVTWAKVVTEAGLQKNQRANR